MCSPNGGHQKLGTAMELEESGNYTEAGNGYLRAALDLISRAELDQAKDSLLLAARAFEKDESWRKIGALWERLALYIESNQTLEKTTVDSLIQHHVIGLETWQAQKDSHHKAAWAFQWAAQHVWGFGSGHA